MKILHYYREALRRSRIARVGVIIGLVLALWAGINIGVTDGPIIGVLTGLAVWIFISAAVVLIKWVLMPTR